MRLAFFLLLIACGGSKAPPPTPKGPPAPTTATPAPGDIQVATVNGKPVWGSCVQAQAARLRVMDRRGAASEPGPAATARDALQQCIGFELLAQEAERRGLATDSEVAIATRTALVSQLVAQEYEDKFNTPEEFGTYWTRSIERNKMRFDHPEARGSVYVRADLAKNATPADEAKAKAVIDDIYAALEDERGLMKPHVEDIANRINAGRTKVSIAAVPPDIKNGRLDDTYTGALFSIPEVGRVAAPVRTPWGWDIVLFDSVVPEVHATREEMIESALPEIKRSYFPQWVNRIVLSLGVHIQVEDKNLPLLENL